MPPKNSPKPENKNLEKRPTTEETPQLIIDVSGYWDTESRNEKFVAEIKKLKIYRPDLLYCGFLSSKAKKNGVIFCGNEEELKGEDIENPIDYAFVAADNNRIPKIAVYDPLKMQKTEGVPHEYKIEEESALLAVLKIINKN